ncbi:RING finger 39-like [Pelobates cultripes]|uniref:RING finger 39-like n=1 Tax=Pelobates cultripes TaxID=61616 RepID=A0AAD1SXG8_PELCU|nr:RING finger 39-like [Pelobates cultripes]
MSSPGSMQELQEGSVCPLCACYFEDPVTTECGHSYCRGCLVTHTGRKQSTSGQLICPKCGRAMSWKGVTTDIQLGVTTRIARRLNLPAPPKRKKFGAQGLQ